jgi:hypothetical protein
MNIETRTLDQQRSEFSSRPLLAMPLAGLIAWLIIGVAGVLLDDKDVVWITFAATGSIVYLGMFLSKFTGENFIGKNKTKNVFDGLFMLSVGMALLVYSIAIPFFIIDYTSLPMTIGILSGLMWMPLSWIIRHWVGIFHSVVRTISIVVLWYAFPDQRFVYIPFCIVIIYVITLVILKNRKEAKTY